MNIYPENYIVSYHTQEVMESLRKITPLPGEDGYYHYNYPAKDILLSKYTNANRTVEKEPETVAWIEKYMNPGEVLWDIGANIGMYSLIAAHNGVKVVAVEPAILTAGQLIENIVLNGLHGKIIPIPFGIGVAEGVSTFNYFEIWPGSSGHNSGHPNRVSFTHPHFYITLNRLMTFVPKPSHIKIDIDGHDFNILEKATDVLNYKELRTIQMEVGITPIGEISKISECFKLFGFEFKTVTVHDYKISEFMTEENLKSLGRIGNALWERK